WTPMSTVNEPPETGGFSTIWTGDRMICWGGGNGARYDPVTDSWTPTYSGPPVAARSHHRSTWTGSFMVVWGGEAGTGVFATGGGRYDPATDTWMPLSTVGEPPPRTDL